MSISFLLQLNKDYVLLNQQFDVATQVSESIIVKYVHKSCDIAKANEKTIMDLIVVDLLKCNVILGINWLAANPATLDCNMKIVKFNLSSKPSCIAQGDQSLAPYNLILKLSVQRMLKNKCQWFLAVVWDVNS